jgi:hypothetical protein
LAEKAAAAGAEGGRAAAGEDDWPVWLEIVFWAVGALIGGLLSALGGAAGVRLYKVAFRFTTTLSFSLIPKPFRWLFQSERATGWRRWAAAAALGVVAVLWRRRAAAGGEAAAGGIGGTAPVENFFKK